MFKVAGKKSFALTFKIYSFMLYYVRFAGRARRRKRRERGSEGGRSIKYTDTVTTMK